MPVLPQPVQDLIAAFERLPGIGPKSASRLTFYLLRAAEDITDNLTEALSAIKRSTGSCSVCHNITLAEQDVCELCSAEDRDESIVCVVEEPIDVLMLERTGGFFGRYHVLHGVLSPIEGVGPDDIKMASLVERAKTGKVKEVIVATNPSMEGDATGLYIQQQLAPLPNVRVTRLARGLPVGGDLEYADQNTLLRALAGRQEIN
ncbi:MAG: recombination protein RecR [Anaerolineaceae bacterium]|nr:recombination protein RecR [Anaerolineaceae bacterium]